MPKANAILPDKAARLVALTDHDRTLLVEAGAGSGKTALMAGRVAMMLVSGISPKEIVAITFTEAAASELLERIEKFSASLSENTIPVELEAALPNGLSDSQLANVRRGASTLDELTCSTIHGFCQQLVRPYPVEAGIDPGAEIIDPSAAELAFQDLTEAWLSARFGRELSAEGLGRIPAISGAGGSEDFFAELVSVSPDRALDLITKAASFLKEHRTASAPISGSGTKPFAPLISAIDNFADWYENCQIQENSTAELVSGFSSLKAVLEVAEQGPLSGRKLAKLLMHERPSACKSNSIEFARWGRKGAWANAAKASGQTGAYGERLSAAGDALYQNCGIAYSEFCSAIGQMAFQKFVAEFEVLKALYARYKRDAALLDFDDLLILAKDLLVKNEAVRVALAARFPRILVDEFQDTDPIQAEIFWHLAGEGNSTLPWYERQIRPGSLFLVGDPKQAIYRFRGADVATYLTAKNALQKTDPASVIEITANFRSQKPILDFVNQNFSSLLDVAVGQPGFSALNSVRATNSLPAVATFEISIGDHHKNANGSLSVDAIRREEASRVAAIVNKLIGSYPVYNKEAKKFQPAKAGDIALLAPTGTSLWIYERALEGRDVPIATQAGKGFFNRQEVQDLIAVARTIADKRDTLALGSLIRGPLVGMTEEEIADEIHALQESTEKSKPLHLWTDLNAVNNPILKQTLAILQNLARKARRATPYQLMAEAIEELHVRPMLKARYRHGSERALANVELLLEMSRPYAVRGIADFARALAMRWEEAESQSEGRPDAESDAVNIITMHSSKGLEWPIVIPINSTTRLNSRDQFLYRRLDDTVHFQILGYDSQEYRAVKQAEADEEQRERVRLWYVALTRARDLLLLPNQNERIQTDWASLMPDIDFIGLPSIDESSLIPMAIGPTAIQPNCQDQMTWSKEATAISANELKIRWRQPSRHEMVVAEATEEFEIYSSPELFLEQSPEPEPPEIQGGRDRGSILHKLIEEILTQETDESLESLQRRAAEFITQFGVSDNSDPAAGLSSVELAKTALNGLNLPEIQSIRSLLRPEVPVYGAVRNGNSADLTSGIADAIALNPQGEIETIIDWKSDVSPSDEVIKLYTRQVRDYLDATGTPEGMIVFLTSGRVVKITARIEQHWKPTKKTD